MYLLWFIGVWSVINTNSQNTEISDKAFVMRNH